MAGGIVGVLLAAGRARRFGADKLLAPLPSEFHDDAAGTPVAVAAARHLVRALPRSVAVVRAGDVALARMLQATGLVVVPCARADDGMGASLACGITAASDADGWVVALADMPWIRPDTIARIAHAIESGATIAAPLQDGERGHPVGFAAQWRRDLEALTGDEGARHIVAAHRHELLLIPVDDAGVLRDVDTPDDLPQP